MPIYEYVCDDCGHQFDALQKMSDPPLATCPECRADALKKKISAPLFRLAGSGWYETDFKKDKQRNVLKADGAEKDGGGKDKDATGAGKGESAGKGDSGKGKSTPKAAKSGGTEAAA